ncbi:22822_t:CDS:1, partial [Dentiscutata erythropus]
SSYYSLVTVAIPHIPLFLGDVINQIQFTKIRGCIVAEEALPIILSAASSCPSLKYLIIAGKGEVSEEYHERINSLGLIVSTFEEIEEIGKQSKIEHVIA